jgi:hypothetical protein
MFFQDTSANSLAKIVLRAAMPCLVLSLCLVIVAGCGKRYGTVPVQGKITFNGGPMPTEGVIYFTPTETFGNHPLRPASASFGIDGVYSVSSFAGAEGLFPGKYEAHLHCWKVPRTMSGPKEVSYLPEKYSKPKTSELKLTVEEGSSSKEFNIDIQGAP